METGTTEPVNEGSWWAEGAIIRGAPIMQPNFLRGGDAPQVCRQGLRVVAVSPSLLIPRQAKWAGRSARLLQLAHSAPATGPLGSCNVHVC